MIALRAGGAGPFDTGVLMKGTFMSKFLREQVNTYLCPARAEPVVGPDACAGKERFEGDLISPAI